MSFDYTEEDWTINKLIWSKISGKLDSIEDIQSAKQTRRQSSHPDSRFIRLSEASRISGYHRDTLKGYAQSGEIIYSRHNNRWFLDRESFNKFLDRISIKPVAKRGRPGRPRLLREE